MRKTMLASLFMTSLLSIAPSFAKDKDNSLVILDKKCSVLNTAKSLSDKQNNEIVLLYIAEKYHGISGTQAIARLSFIMRDGIPDELQLVLAAVGVRCAAEPDEIIGKVIIIETRDVLKMQIINPN